MKSPTTLHVDDTFVGPHYANEQQLMHFRAKADGAIQDALQKFRMRRTRRASRAAAQTDEVTPTENTSNHSTSHAVGTVKGRYTDLLEHLKSETREVYFNVHKMLFNFTCDARVLYTAPLTPLTTANGAWLQHEAIKWAAYKLFPLPGCADSIHYEATGQGADAYGRTYAFHVVVPAIIPEVASKTSVRILSTQVVIARPHDTSESSSDIFFSIQTDFRSSHIRQILSSRFCASRQSVVALLSSALPPTNPWVVKRGTWVQPRPPSCCTSCLRAFTILRGRHNCVVCSSSVCRKCAVKATTVLNAIATKLRGSDPTANRSLCSPCATLLCEDAEPTPETESPPSYVEVFGGKTPGAERSPCKPSFSPDVQSVPFVQSSLSESSIEQKTCLSALGDAQRPSNVRAKRTSALSSWTPKKRGAVSKRTRRGLLVPLSTVEEEPSRPSSPTMRFTAATSRRTRTEASDALHRISAALLTQSAPRTQRRVHMATQRRRRTE